MNWQDSFRPMADPLPIALAALFTGDHRATLVDDKSACVVDLGTGFQLSRVLMLLWQEVLFTGPVSSMSRRTL